LLGGKRNHRKKKISANELSETPIALNEKDKNERMGHTYLDKQKVNKFAKRHWKSIEISQISTRERKNHLIGPKSATTLSLFCLYKTLSPPIYYYRICSIVWEIGRYIPQLEATKVFGNYLMVFNFLLFLQGAVEVTSILCLIRVLTRYRHWVGIEQRSGTLLNFARNTEKKALYHQGRESCLIYCY